MLKGLRVALTAGAAFAMAGAADAADRVQTKDVAVSVDTLATGLDHPWAVEVMPDGAYLVTERPGNIRIIRDGKVSEPLAGVPEVSARGQGGLMDVALSPDFAQSRIFYFTAATANAGGSGTEAFSAKLSADESRLEDVKPIFTMAKFTGGNIQYGSRIAIAGDGSLFISVGDRGSRDRSQDFKDDAGSIVHVNADGSIPADNPFRDGAKARPEIWSKGHRNPQGITFDAADGKLYTVEHGARGGDEINLIAPAKNYGWPVITYGVDYSGAKIHDATARTGMEQPVKYWVPSIAPSGMAFYTADLFPAWKGNLFVGALAGRLLVRLELDGEKVTREERLLTDLRERIRDVRQGPDGAIWLLTDSSNGRLLRVTPAK